MSHTPNGWAPLQLILQDILLSHNNGMTEFELFELLKSPPYELFTSDALRNPLSLFQSHFILFNALYQLQDTWLKNKTGRLQIHCTNIRKEPWKSGQTGQSEIVAQDKLRAYYLDWTNLSDTDQSEVEELLEDFWAAFSGISNHIKNNNMSQQKALDFLNLASPFSAQQLKQQYRKMLHLHHPDKGGDNGHTAELHNAYERLKAECL